MARSSICPVFQIFEMNIKAACTGNIAAQTRDLIALMKLHEKLLISIKKSLLMLVVCAYFEKKNGGFGVFDSNDAKVSPLRIADCARVKLINDVPWRFRPN